MKGVFLNLPYKTKVVRKFNCSYNSPTFLVPPLELISLAAVFREIKYSTTHFIDAIADNLSITEVSEMIQEINPELIISIAGVEFLEHDLLLLNEIKKTFPAIRIILFGHYAGEFPVEILEKSDIDIIIHGEPELIFKEIVEHLHANKTLSAIKGITFRDKKNNIIHNSGAKRIPNPNDLPIPAYDLLNIKEYSEPFFPKPYGIIQSARGCPYSCNYCIKTFGTKLTALTPENMFSYVQHLVDLHQIQSFRFVDDTFTATPGRVISFCKLLIENNLNYLKWSCFSRPDTLNKEMVKYMKMAGCSRIYIGVESGSQKILDFYNKGLKIDQTKEDILFCRKQGIELIGFFMVGAPDETKEDLNMSIQYAIDCGFDFITTFQFMVYPGTSIFNKFKDKVDFSVLPYQNKFKDESIVKKAEQYQKIFFKRFYLRFGFLKSILRLLRHNDLKEIFKTAYSFFLYLFFNKKDKNRKDYI